MSYAPRVVIPAARRDAVRKRVLAWWDAGHRQLPWRFSQHGADPYRVWLAEVMLQQTRVAAVIPYYTRFLERFPTLEALAQASEEEVLAQWSGLGYYARGRRLLAAAREALARHSGLPASLDALAALPGFGGYTAGAVASIAFALRAPCVDGNAARVLARLFLVAGAPEEQGTRRRLWALARELVPAGRPGDFNQALMELGATVCGRRAPDCARCPVASLCHALRAGRQQEIPRARRRRERARLDVACALIERRGALLMARRPADGLFGGLWELPSAVVAQGEDPRAALRRELRERLALRVSAGEELAAVERTLTHRRLHFVAYRCRARVPPPCGRLRLVGREAIGRLALAAAMRALILALFPAVEGAGRPSRRALA